MRIKISFLIIFFIGLVYRFFYFPNDLPLFIDGLDNFTYATAINFHQKLPIEWTPINNGWPIFLSFMFSIVNLENTLQYMQFQRIISIILSSLITIPIYFLCRKYFDEKIALVGAALFAFDPRIVLNSLLGITEPLFILLGVSSLVLFLKYKRKEMIMSFVLASCCTIVRSEGIFLFFTLTILFFLRYKISKEILITYMPAMTLFLLLLIPIMDYRIEVAGYDGIFQRVGSGTSQISTMLSSDRNDDIINGLELFIKYLGWVLIPNFLIFLPFGIIQFFRRRNKETNFIIIFLVFSSLPILYACFVQAEDTRYLFFLFPIFSLISLYAVQSYISKVSRKNLILFLMIIGILTSSLIFYQFEKTDFDKEKEIYEIAKNLPIIPTGINHHPGIATYIANSEIPNEWPFVFYDKMRQTKFISTKNFNNIEDFISNSRDDLTHLIIDDKSNQGEFLQYVFQNEEEFEYLEKIFDSREMGYNYHFKLFKIKYEVFDLT